MFIPDPNFFIPDPGLKRHKIPFPNPQQRILAFKTKKCHHSQISQRRNIGFLDLGSRMQDPDFSVSEPPDPEVKIASDPGSVMLE
jgi:hypothetical protein